MNFVSGGFGFTLKNDEAIRVKQSFILIMILMFKDSDKPEVKWHLSDTFKWYS